MTTISHEPLPLDAFEIDCTPPLLRPGHAGPPVAAGSWTAAVSMDDRLIPFRLIRASDEPRPIAVLVHGMGITAATFWPISGHLFATHDLLVVDYNSFAAARTWPRGGVSLRGLAAGLARVILRLGLRDATLVGSSLGGGLALLATMLLPAGRVGRLVLINPAVYPQPLPGRYRLAAIPLLGHGLMATAPPAALIDGVAYVGYTANDRMPPLLRASYEANMRPRANRLILRDVMAQLGERGQAVREFVATLSSITQPALVCWGRQERLLLPDAGPRLARDLPEAHLITYERLAHLPHEEAPARVGGDIARFLEQSLG